MPVLELDFERGAGKRFDDAADEAQRVFFDDRRERFTALLAAAAFSFWRRNGVSLRAMCALGVPFDPRCRFASECRFRRAGAPAQPNFTASLAVAKNVMLVGAIVFGMVGVAAGFAWDYVIARDRDD